MVQVQVKDTSAVPFPILGYCQTSRDSENLMAGRSERLTLITAFRAFASGGSEQCWHRRGLWLASSYMTVVPLICHKRSCKKVAQINVQVLICFDSYSYVCYPCLPPLCIIVKQVLPSSPVSWNILATRESRPSRLLKYIFQATSHLWMEFLHERGTRCSFTWN